MSTRNRAAGSTDRRLLGRAFDLLAFMVDGAEEAFGVRELAAKLGIPPSGVHRALVTLTSEGMVTRNDDGRYSLGVGFLRLAWKATARHSIRDAAEPVLRDLVSHCDETALLALYERGRHELIFALAVQSSHPLRYFIAINEWLPAHSGASGMAVCAFVPAPELEAISRMRPVAFDGRRGNQLEEVRSTGYAISHGERIDGAVGVASAIFGPDGHVVGTVALSIPEFRFDESRAGDLGGGVREAAMEVTHRIGGTWPLLAARSRRPPATAGTGPSSKS